MPVAALWEYAKPTKQGRSHATRHHLVAERSCSATSCHQLLHNPVLLPDDVKRFLILVRKRGLSQDKSPMTTRAPPKGAWPDFGLAPLLGAGHNSTHTGGRGVRYPEVYCAGVIQWARVPHLTIGVCNRRD